ncbi:decaprenyl-diphosphate synthase-like protein subunit 1 [Dipodascopsis uninucleata]
MSKYRILRAQSVLTKNANVRNIKIALGTEIYDRRLATSYTRLNYVGDAIEQVRARRRNNQPSGQSHASSVASPASSTVSNKGAVSNPQDDIHENDNNKSSDYKKILDPFSVVAAEMSYLTSNIRELLGSGHPSLDTAAKYYVRNEGKHIRPLLVLLMSRAVMNAPKSELSEPRYEGVDDSLSPLDILRDWNPSKLINSIATTVSQMSKIGKTSDPLPIDEETGILSSQKRLAEITEMIHAASLMHDDVIDGSALRRGAPSLNITFGNKMAILAGDFMLGRASVSLARLRNLEVVELMSTVIANLVEGEFMQLKNMATDEVNGGATKATFDYYMDKTYLKTASLISKSCRSAAILAGVHETIVDSAYYYGRNLGLAFQLVDDLLDYTVSAQDLGKPSGADLQLGLATAPVLFAWQKYPELGDLIKRKFSEPGDIEKARNLVALTDGVEQTRELAQEYGRKARESLDSLPNSSAKDALNEMTHLVLNRKK